MKRYSLLAISFLLFACGDSERDTQSTLQAIEQEMSDLKRAEEHYQSEKNQALVGSAASGFAIGYGAVTDDAATFGAGVGGASRSADQYERAHNAQIEARIRQASLELRRQDLLKK